MSSDPWENRVAILEDGTLSEIYFEREERVIGSIYKGKVQNVLVALGASFIDIGLGRNAFLYVDDINKTPLNIGDVEITQGRSGWTINEKVNRGDDVLVQIVKEPRGLKGARVSTNITLPGRYLILMPTGKYSGVSRKIDSAEERNRLKAVMKMIRPEGMATVVRTAAAGVSQAELIADLGVLIRMWHGILETFKRATAPALIHKDMNLIFKAARDFITPDVGKVLIDDEEEFEKVRDFMRLLGPQYVDRIEHYNHGRALFKDYKLDDELQKLLRPKINLQSGGSIVIESTEALTVIDVNSGKSTGSKSLEDTIVKTNIEAAAEIARQVRLRDIGGIIVCDFIDMNSESSRNKVIATLETGLRRDRTRTTIQSFSARGLLEFTRKRIGKDQSGQLRAACPTCAGLGSVLSPETVAIETFRELRHMPHAHRDNGRAATESAKAIQVHAAPTVGAQLEYWYEDEMTNLERELGSRVDVVVDPGLHPEKTTVNVAAGGDGPSPDGVRVGDEFEVDLLHARLPDPESALAVVGNRLVEVQNAANAAGQTIRIKVIDIDEDGHILAEPRVAVAAAAKAAEGKRRRRRGGRGRRKPLTAAEQAQELRELAEEAARGLGGRAAAIGISTAAEAEREAAILHAAPLAPVEYLPTASPPPPRTAWPRTARRPTAAAAVAAGAAARTRQRRGPPRPCWPGIPAASATVQTVETDIEEENADAGAPTQANGEAERRRRPPPPPRTRRGRSRGDGSRGRSPHLPRRRGRRRRSDRHERAARAEPRARSVEGAEGEGRGRRTAAQPARRRGETEGDAARARRTRAAKPGAEPAPPASPLAALPAGEAAPKKRTTRKAATAAAEAPAAQAVPKKRATRTKAAATAAAPPAAKAAKTVKAAKAEKAPPKRAAAPAAAAKPKAAPKKAETTTKAAKPAAAPRTRAAAAKKTSTRKKPG